MDTPVSRAVVIAMVVLALAGAYALISGNAASGPGPEASAKRLLVPIEPPSIAGEVLEGTGI